MIWPWKRNATQAHPDVPAPEDETVNILRFMHPDCISVQHPFEPSPIPVDETGQQRERRLISDKERLIQDLCDVLDRSNEIINPTKFYKDMVNRERKATTAIAPGIAIPHVRSLQCRRFVMGFVSSRTGLWYGSLDGSATRAFFLMASPPYEDKLYLRVYRQFAEMMQHDWILESLLDCESPTDVLNVLRGYIQS